MSNIINDNNVSYTRINKLWFDPLSKTNKYRIPLIISEFLYIYNFDIVDSQNYLINGITRWFA